MCEAFAQDDFSDLAISSLLPSEADLRDSSHIADHEMLSRSSSTKSTDTDLSGDNDNKVQDAMEELFKLFASNVEVDNQTTQMEMDGEVQRPLYGSSALPLPKPCRYFRRFWIGISGRMIAADNERRLSQNQEFHRQRNHQNQTDGTQ